MPKSPPAYEATASDSKTADNDGTREPPPSGGRIRGSDEDVPPPPYGDVYGTIGDPGDEYGTTASLTDDGRVTIRINQKAKGLSSLLGPALRSHLDLVGSKGYEPKTPAPSAVAGEPDGAPPPPLNVVMHVVGSRGDVQPFIALGKVLKEKHGHRVRLATHPVFKDFVEENGLEFFSISGDPAELMAFMVKNPGLMPGFDVMRRGDIGKRRKEIGNMVRGCWRSCIEAGDGTGPAASDNTVEDWASADSGTGIGNSAKPFVADAIIANPPSFAHLHCAEKLGIPLHMMFTMPWSPTQAFPHPLANIQSTNAEVNMTNFMSYALVDMMTWQGLGDVINRFREKSLGLEPLSLTWAPGMLARLRVPWTYCWSPALIPQPKDWGSFISISGFYFLTLGSDYTPEPDLAAFLDAGPPPVYIGFGSIVVDDPNAMTRLIFDAVKKSGQRALVSKGWGGVGGDQIGIPEGVFMLGNVPHDWLFKRVSCVVHHGGAGTTAAGIASGKPTVVVPFFGDQAFWGAMVARAGAGPKPVPYKELTPDILAASIEEALTPRSLEKAKELSESISHEKGTDAGAENFHKMLDVDNLRCVLAPDRAAVWRLKKTEVRLSAFAATVLGNEGLIKFADLNLYRSREHETEEGPWDPITGGASALIGTMGSMAMGVADLPIPTLKALKIHPDAPKSQPKSSKSPPAGKVGREAGEPPSKSPDGAATSPGPSNTSSSTSLSPTESNQGPAVAAAVGNDMAAAAAAAESGDDEQSPSGDAKKPSSKYDVKSALGESTKLPTSASASSSKSALQKAAAANNFDLESGLETAKGAFRFASAGFKSPMDFTLGLAQGFHNAPKLYGDESVRKPERITDFSSGVRAASKEFGYGFYDGITGLVTQPMEGARKEGAAGFIKGFAKGIGGVVLKPGAAVWGIPGYTSKGIYKELQKRFGPSVENYVIASRTAQGYEDVRAASQEERAAVVRRWKEIKPYIRRNKKWSGEQREALQAKQEELKTNMAAADGAAGKGKGPQSGVQGVEANDSIDLPSPEPEERLGLDSPSHLDERDEELEEAIRRSVAETSKGNAEEDELVERAIRASVAELEAGTRRGNGDAEVQEAVHRSLEEARGGFQRAREGVERERKGNMEGGYGEVDEGDAEEGEDDDEEMEMALRESKEHATEEEEARKEEEIVMRYMMKQSLAEEEARKARAAKGE